MSAFCTAARLEQTGSFRPTFDASERSAWPTALRTGHEAALLPPRLNRIATAQAVRAVVVRVEWVGNSTVRLPCRPATGLGGWRRSVGRSRRRNFGDGRDDSLFPRRHHVGDRLWLTRDRLRRRGARRWRGPGGEAVVPRLGADPEVHAAGGPLLDAAPFVGSRTTSTTRLVRDPPLSGMRRSGLSSAQSREDVVDVRHGSPSISAA